MITLDGTVSTVAGAAGQAGNTDGAALQARFSSPLSLSFDSAGNLLILEHGAIRQLSPQGVVSTVVGRLGAGASVLPTSSRIIHHA